MASVLIYKYTPTVSTLSGTWSGTTPYFSGGLCRQVYIKGSSGTIFSAKLVDEGDMEIRSWDDETGYINDLTPFFVSGRYTLTIFDATVDEAFTVLICVNDS